MIEKLKKLEQEAMDELDPEVFDDISSGGFSNEQWEFYLTGYIEGLQKAIILASEDSSTMSYEVDLNQVYDDHDTN
tara:strand:+ start:506 stop:733 length:228 start_codon:yes stop_codon:yes gene_type:complete